MKKILILGGTGMLGAPVVHQMLADGFELRLLVRNPEKARNMFADHVEIMAGDVTDITILEQAMTGCSGVHISVGGQADQISAENVAKLAPKLGLQRILYVSGSTVAKENAWFPMTAQKLRAEAAVCESGVPYTILRPTWPMEQLPRFVIGGQATVVGVLTLPWHWFAADDFARMVSAAFQQQEAAGKELYVHGPEALTVEHALDRYRQAFYPEIESVTVMPIDVARQIAASTGNNFLNIFADMMDYFKKAGEPGDPSEANELLGKPTTTLDQWIEQRKVEIP